jgi:hypothetical protein
MHYYINEATQRVVPTSMSHSDVHKLYTTQAEAEKVIVSLPYLASLMDQVAAAKAILIDRKQYKRIAELLECLAGIHGELDGKEWDSDTTQNIRDLLCAFGIPVRGIDEDGWTQVEFRGERWAYNEDSVACWDDALGFDFRFFHQQGSPSDESILEALAETYPEVPA